MDVFPFLLTHSEVFLWLVSVLLSGQPISRGGGCTAEIWIMCANHISAGSVDKWIQMPLKTADFDHSNIHWCKPYEFQQ